MTYSSTGLPGSPCVMVASRPTSPGRHSFSAANGVTFSLASTPSTLRRTGSITARIHTAIESIAYLRTIPYTEYRQSAWWKQRREQYRADRYGNCDLCKQASHKAEDGEWLPLKFHVHHLNYDNIGDERDEDLSLLCSRCHNLVHYPESTAAQAWLQQQIARAIEIGVGEDWIDDHLPRVEALRPKAV